MLSGRKVKVIGREERVRIGSRRIQRMRLSIDLSICTLVSTLRARHTRQDETSKPLKQEVRRELRGRDGWAVSIRRRSSTFSH